PLSIVSASSRPGSRRWACRSTNAGATTSPSQSTTVAPFAPSPLPTAAITPFSTRTSRTASRPVAGSTTRPPLSRIALGIRTAFLDLRTAELQVQQRLPDGDAVGNLIGDHRAFELGDVGGDLDSAIHR